ncbi:carbonate dehydratase [Martiniozyma asiatica (nom. inval.)]|nr:carbonate dehydratase [Martiniozyma asiatica]
MSLSESTVRSAVSALPQTAAPAPGFVAPKDESYPFRLNKNSTLKDYLAANKSAMDKLKIEHPEIMPISGKGQSPHTLWIGCSDSRINECTALGCLPGEVFTLRNIANVINTSDLSSQSALQFAIEVLKVKKIIVCGHTDCGGVWASLSNKKTGGVLDHWLAPVRAVRAEHLEDLKQVENVHDKCKKLSELNVINSVNIIKKNPSFVEANAKGDVEIYGLIYDVETGYMKELDTGAQTLHEVFHLQNDA